MLSKFILFEALLCRLWHFNHNTIRDFSFLSFSFYQTLSSFQKLSSVV